MSDIESNPQNVLIVYGSLKPGEVNHHLVANIKGEWIDGTVSGEIGSWRQYLRFLHNTVNAQTLAVKLLISAELPNHWERLDAFEGEAYERIVIEAETARGTVRGCIYAKPSTTDPASRQ